MPPRSILCSSLITSKNCSGTFKLQVGIAVEAVGWVYTKFVADNLPEISIYTKFVEDNLPELRRHLRIYTNFVADTLPKLRHQLGIYTNFVADTLPKLRHQFIPAPTTLNVDHPERGPPTVTNRGQ
jgi:hypothetical protein